jgi:hypothetical protein
LFNAATQAFKQLLYNKKNDCIQTILQGLTPTESTDYSLWQATKKLKQVKKPSPPLRTSHGPWTRNNIEKTHAFAEQLAQIFQPYRSENESKEEAALIQFLETPYQQEPSLNHLKRAEVEEVFNSINPKKSSAYEIISGRILKELPIIGIKYVTKLFVAVLLKGYFTAQWKVAQIIIILKP